MTEEDRNTLKVRLVDACLKGYSLRFTNTRGVATIYMHNNRSFWTVAKMRSSPGGGDVDYATYALPLKDALYLIDAFWPGMQVDRQTLTELDYWLPARSEA
jgi:hypothetical protein